MTRNKPPSPHQILKARRQANLTQAEAAELVGYGYRVWQEWEAGRSPMRVIVWEAFKQKAFPVSKN